MSDLFKLNWADLGKAVLLAFITTFLGGVYAIIQTGAFPTLAELGAAAMAGLGAALAYLVKNFFTNSQNKLAAPEPK
jgi:predicted exporter